ncbi:hypothetical protein ZWY2020_018685 [Hordeum vulgare]|nr:hypothetical protein ZWY2020_018685 [Hordeum vulgare]
MDGGGEELGADQSSATAARARTGPVRLLLVPVEASAAVAPARPDHVRLPRQLGCGSPSGVDCCFVARSSCCPDGEASPPIPMAPWRGETRGALRNT